MDIIIVNIYNSILNREVQITNSWILNNLMKPNVSYSIRLFIFHLMTHFLRFARSKVLS